MTEADTASALMSGDLPVLGTPRLIAWLEAATCEAARSRLQAGQSTVGTRVAIEHRAPSAIGAAVVVTARLTGAEERILTFDVEAVDRATGRVLADGVITRAVVDERRFMGRLEARGLGTGEVTIVRDRTLPSRREAARIWAAATARRDDDPEPAPTEAALPIVERGLEPAGATLHLASVRERPSGFAVVVPRQAGPEILYLGVDPPAWGNGLAGRLLSDIVEYAEESSRSEIDLWVYDDNARAVGVYLRAGWSATEDTRTHPHSGRIERRYARRLTDPPG